MLNEHRKIENTLIQSRCFTYCGVEGVEFHWVPGLFIQTGAWLGKIIYDNKWRGALQLFSLTLIWPRSEIFAWKMENSALFWQFSVIIPFYCLFPWVLTKKIKFREILRFFRDWEKFHPLILVLPWPDGLMVCVLCFQPESEDGNEMVFCDNCDICVHQVSLNHSQASLEISHITCVLSYSMNVKFRTAVFAFLYEWREEYQLTSIGCWTQICYVHVVSMYHWTWFSKVTKVSSYKNTYHGIGQHRQLVRLCVIELTLQSNLSYPPPLPSGQLP